VRESGRSGSIPPRRGNPTEKGEVLYAGGETIKGTAKSLLVGCDHDRWFVRRKNLRGVERPHIQKQPARKEKVFRRVAFGEGNIGKGRIVGPWRTRGGGGGLLRRKRKELFHIAT